MATNPPEKKAPSRRSRMATSLNQRKAFERDNPARGADLYDSMAGKINDDAAERFKNLTISPEAVPKATRETVEAVGTPKDVYTHYGFRGANTGRAYDQPTLPGMDEASVPVPGTIPRAQRWEELHPKERQNILRSAKMFGVTPESAHRSLAAQIDRANIREDGVHHSFYSTEGQAVTGANMPREQLIRSANAASFEGNRPGKKVEFYEQAMANSMTSPNSRFVQTPKSGERKGQTVYPNDEAASLAIQWAKEGRSGSEYVNHPDYKVPAEDKVLNPRTGKMEKQKGDPRKYPVQGYPENQAKAIEAVKKTQAGASVAQAWGLESKARYADPKVGPFQNSWVNPHGEDQFWVSDTHSGPGAFAPHLNSTAQELSYMSIPGIHAFHDHVARNVMAERGLSSISGTQSQHWSQEKYEQGHRSDVEDMRPARPGVSQQFTNPKHPNEELGGIDWDKHD